MSRKRCRAELDLHGETYVCDRRKGHGKPLHRAPYSERMYGADLSGQYAAKLGGGTVVWRRVRDRRA